MFVLLQRRDRAELILTVDGDGPALEEFMDRFDMSKACCSSSLSVSLLIMLSSQEAGSIALLADSEFEFVSSPPYQPSSPGATPVSDIAHDSPSALPYGSPMSDPLSSPSPMPLEAEIDSVEPAEDRSRPPSPDTAMEVVEEVSVEVIDEEPPPPSMVDLDLPVDAPVSPPSTSSEAAPAETHAETLLVEDLSDLLEGTEETMDSVTPSEAGPVQLVVEPDEDSRSEELASPVNSEKVIVDEAMDIDVVGEPRAEADEPVLLTPERRSQSAVPPRPQASATEAQTPPPPPLPVSAPVLALPPSAFILPPRPSTEVFIPAALAPIGESPHYSLDLATVEPRSLTTSEWLNPEFSLNRNYTLPFAKSLPLDQQRRLKLGKSLRKKDKEKDKVPDSRKDGIDDWTPLGINKWGVTIKANPLWKRVSRATKTMGTRDWNVRILSCLYFCAPQQYLGGIY
jgi:chromatin modification-related protein VID21